MRILVLYSQNYLYIILTYLLNHNKVFRFSELEKIICDQRIFLQNKQNVIIVNNLFKLSKLNLNLFVIKPLAVYYQWKALIKIIFYEL